MTTPSAANSSAPSIPENESAWSAAPPAGPVTCTETPLSPSPAVVRSRSATFFMSDHPALPMSMGTITSAACGGVSFDAIGPVVPGATLGSVPKRCACAPIVASSAGLSPVGFS